MKCNEFTSSLLNLLLDLLDWTLRGACSHHHSQHNITVHDSKIFQVVNQFAFLLLVQKLRMKYAHRYRL